MVVVVVTGIGIAAANTVHGTAIAITFVIIGISIRRSIRRVFPSIKASSPKDSIAVSICMRL